MIQQWAVRLKYMQQHAQICTALHTRLVQQKPEPADLNAD